MSMLYLQWIKFKNWLCYKLFPELNKPPVQEEPLEGVLSNPRVVDRPAAMTKRPKTNTKKKIRITTKKKESVK